MSSRLFGKPNAACLSTALAAVASRVGTDDDFRISRVTSVPASFRRLEPIRQPGEDGGGSTGQRQPFVVPRPINKERWKLAGDLSERKDADLILLARFLLRGLPLLFGLDLRDRLRGCRAGESWRICARPFFGWAVFHSLLLVAWRICATVAVDTVLADPEYRSGRWGRRSTGGVIVF